MRSCFDYWKSELVLVFFVELKFWVSFLKSLKDRESEIDCPIAFLVHFVFACWLLLVFLGFHLVCSLSLVGYLLLFHWGVAGILLVLLITVTSLFCFRYCCCCCVVATARWSFCFFSLWSLSRYTFLRLVLMWLQTAKMLN